MIEIKNKDDGHIQENTSSVSAQARYWARSRPRKLAIHCHQDNNNIVTMNGYQARKINEIRSVIF